MAITMDSWLAVHATSSGSTRFIGSLAEIALPAIAGLIITSFLMLWRSRSKGTIKAQSEIGGARRVVDSAMLEGSKKRSSEEESTEDDSTISPTSSIASLSETDGGLNHERFLRAPHLQGTLVPTTGLVRSNPVQPYPFEYPNCSGHFVPLHRPTGSSSLEKSGNYPFGNHFAGRKRLWEIRIQFQVKQPVEGNMLIGLELENYVPLNGTAKKLMGLTVSALRRVVGDDLYHSVGDDPRQGSAPHEKPVFMMPLWACDQLIVTPADEAPPDLTDEHFSSFGQKRADDRKAFVKEMCELQIVPGSIYTVCFWGISQFLDCITWQVKKIVPFKSIDFDKFCGRPPVNIVMYTLSPSVDGETRHVQSRKNYYFRYALWSSARKPSVEKLRELMPSDGNLGSPSPKAARSSFLGRYSPSQLFGCCFGPR